VHRRRDFDGGLVGHHVGQHLVFNHLVARLHAPLDHFNFGNAFAQVGHLDHMNAHLKPPLHV
jgi:hypothetical protein